MVGLAVGNLGVGNLDWREEERGGRGEGRGEGEGYDGGTERVEQDCYIIRGWTRWMIGG